MSLQKESPLLRDIINQSLNLLKTAEPASKKDICLQGIITAMTLSNDQANLDEEYLDELGDVIPSTEKWMSALHRVNTRINNDVLTLKDPEWLGKSPF